eukprot:CAMPEP_0202464136 /NCGR_PEP_ID=MMETSP1360-20130828/60925_1 /ASSEMBLY_ACC=CAM_ASM_000848 /TAXON_ID=515479 /ORGANISM="Licmophora paradoxa, Strain CCMP2313" /LENGTH=221 /DNA_ID=CAMNT_0049087319 /DNA_START=208 /DNA_END=873 /DNA_ORIENTATION=-
MEISHVDGNVVDRIVKKIEALFGKMTVTRGKVHAFLDMTIDYSKPGLATITMKAYLKAVILESGLDVQRKAATPARRTLFDIDETSTLLEETNAVTFWSVTNKLLYVSLRGRPDILLALCFLTTRAAKPTEQDELKLKRLLEYIHVIIDLALHVGADNLHTMFTWIDAAYAVHADMRSQTGGVLSFGHGGLMCKTTKHKLNTKSSTKAEVVRASDYLPNTI